MGMKRTVYCRKTETREPLCDCAAKCAWDDSTAPTPEREARADERIGDERNGRNESVPPAAPQPATLATRLREEVQYHEHPRDESLIALLHEAADFVEAAPQTPAEPVAWRCVDALGPRHITESKRIADFWREFPAEITPLYAPPHSAGPAPDSVAPTVSGSGESSSPSVGSSVAEPTESAIIFGFESASDFEDSRLYKLLSGCRGAALRARITWRAMNEDRRVEVDEWYRMLTGEDWESLGEIPDDDDESFAEYQARIAATEARTLGAKETISHDTRETKDSVVVEADSNAVPSTLSVPRSSPK